MEWVIAVAIGCGVVGFFVGVRLRLEVLLRHLMGKAEERLSADERNVFIELMDKAMGETE